MLEQQLRDSWRVRERATPIQPAMTFAPEGLVLRAGINPPPAGPTPSGFAYYLPNPPAENGEPVTYDDCKWTNGILFEIKGEGLAKLANDLPDVMAGGCNAGW